MRWARHLFPLRAAAQSTFFFNDPSLGPLTVRTHSRQQERMSEHFTDSGEWGRGPKHCTGFN